MQQQREVAVRTVVVDDEAVYRNMLVAMLSREPQIRVIGEFASASEALAEIPGLRPDAALLDISLGPGINGIQLGMNLRASLPGLGIVLLSNTLKPSLLRSLPDRTLSGWSYLHKKNLFHMKTLVRAIRGSAAGSMVLDPTVTARHENLPTAGKVLPPGEMAVLRSLAQGFDDEEIAAEAGLPREAVTAQTHALYERLGIDWESAGVQARMRAVLYYLKEVAADQ